MKLAMTVADWPTAATATTTAPVSGIADANTSVEFQHAMVATTGPAPSARAMPAVARPMLLPAGGRIVDTQTLLVAMAETPFPAASAAGAGADCTGQAGGILSAAPLLAPLPPGERLTPPRPPAARPAPVGNSDLIAVATPVTPTVTPPVVQTMLPLPPREVSVTNGTRPRDLDEPDETVMEATDVVADATLAPSVAPVIVPSLAVGNAVATPNHEESIASSLAGAAKPSIMATAARPKVAPEIAPRAAHVTPGSATETLVLAAATTPVLAAATPMPDAPAMPVLAAETPLAAPPAMLAGTPIRPAGPGLQQPAHRNAVRPVSVAAEPRDIASFVPTERTALPIRQEPVGPARSAQGATRGSVPVEPIESVAPSAPLAVSVASQSSPLAPQPIEAVVSPTPQELVPQSVVATPAYVGNDPALGGPPPAGAVFTASATQPPAASAPVQSPVTTVVTQPHQLAHDVGIVIARQISADGNELHIRLEPAELGQIDVRMSFDDRGKLRAIVGADSAMTLDLLRRDGAELGRAVADAGIRSDSQSFRFEGRGDGRSGDGGQPRPQPSRFTMNEADMPPDTPDQTRFRPLRWRGEIDVMA